MYFNDYRLQIHLFFGLALAYLGRLQIWEIIIPIYITHFLVSITFGQILCDCDPFPIYQVPSKGSASH